MYEMNQAKYDEDCPSNFQTADYLRDRGQLDIVARPLGPLAGRGFALGVGAHRGGGFVVDPVARQTQRRTRPTLVGASLIGRANCGAVHRCHVRFKTVRLHLSKRIHRSIAPPGTPGSFVLSIFSSPASGSIFISISGMPACRRILAFLDPGGLDRLENLLIHAVLRVRLEAVELFDHRTQLRKRHVHRIHVRAGVRQLNRDLINVCPAELHGLPATAGRCGFGRSIIPKPTPGETAPSAELRRKVLKTAKRTAWCGNVECPNARMESFEKSLTISQGNPRIHQIKTRWGQMLLKIHLASSDAV